MNHLLAVIIFAGCFALMAIGLLIAKKTLQRGCSLGPDCFCKNDPQKSSDCEHMPNKKA